MRAVVVSRPGGPEVLELTDLPIPPAVPGRVLIRVRAFGLNRSEHFTRRGFSPSVVFPRVLGIECVGTVVAAPDTPFSPGQTVVALMGGMGRAFDGSYAEHTSVPASNVLPVETTLDWPTLGALPEMFQTAYGSLTAGLEIDRAKNLLVRGGTSSVGLTAIALAHAEGLHVAATTRNLAKADALRKAGATSVVQEKESIADDVRALFPGGAERVLELIGATTLVDSMNATRPGGIVCMTGILGGQWELPAFRPMEQIPTGVKLTSYSGDAKDLSPAVFQRFVKSIEQGAFQVPLARTFKLEEIQEAHATMDENRVAGKIVVLVD